MRFFLARHKPAGRVRAMRFSPGADPQGSGVASAAVCRLRFCLLFDGQNPRPIRPNLTDNIKLTRSMLARFDGLCSCGLSGRASVLKMATVETSRVRVRGGSNPPGNDTNRCRFDGSSRNDCDSESETPDGCDAKELEGTIASARRRESRSAPG